MNSNLYRVKIASYNGYVYVASDNQFKAAELACQNTEEVAERCSVEYIGEVTIESKNNNHDFKTAANNA